MEQHLLREEREVRERRAPSASGLIVCLNIHRDILREGYGGRRRDIERGMDLKGWLLSSAGR